MTTSRFTEPKIVHYGYDLSRQWFVYFRIKDDQGAWYKKVYKRDINRAPTKKDRLMIATAIRNTLSYRLHNGWSPLGQAKDHKTICQVIDDILQTKKSSMKIKSVRTYNDVANMFKAWMKNNQYGHLYPDDITPVIAREYLDHLLVNKKYTGKTHNGHLGILKTIFNAMVDRELAEKNPFRGIKELPEETGKNVAYTDQERKKIRDYLYSNNRRLYYAVQFVYYCFIRRSELIQLKVGDVDLKNMTIRISSAVSKNRKQESVTIPKSFEPALYEMQLDKLPADFYIFGHRFQTCQRKMIRPDNLTESLRKALRKLNIRPECTFYSFKHTGCVNLYNSTKDIYLVSRQCRHHDISMTMRYMRSLGVIVDEKLRNAEFEF